jgi:hypothetical protein
VKQPVYSGLFAHAVDKAGLPSIVDAALRGGASGVSIFSSTAMDDAKWTALSTALRGQGP